MPRKEGKRETREGRKAKIERAQNIKDMEIQGDEEVKR